MKTKYYKTDRVVRRVVRRVASILAVELKAHGGEKKVRIRTHECGIAQLHTAARAPKPALVRHCKAARKVMIKKTAPSIEELARRSAASAERAASAAEALEKYAAGCTACGGNNSLELTAELKEFVLSGCKAVVSRINVEGLPIAAAMTTVEFREYRENQRKEAMAKAAKMLLDVIGFSVLPSFTFSYKPIKIARRKSFYELWLETPDAEAVKAERRRAAADNAAAAAVLMNGKDVDGGVFGKHCHFKSGTASGEPVFVNSFDWADDKKAMVETLYKMGDKKVRPYRSYKVAAKAYRALRHLPEHKFSNLLEYALIDESCADNVHYGRVHLEEHVGDMGERFVDINGALPEELTAIDGIGEKLAMKIIEYRHANGGFASIDEFDVAVDRKGALKKALAGSVKPMVNGEKPYNKVSDAKLFELLLAVDHHEIPERLRDGIKASAPEGQKSIYVQKINFGIRRDLNCYGYVALDVSSVTNNVFTRSYAVGDGSVSLTQVTGYERHIPAGKVATTGIVSVNTGDILRACRGEDDRIEKADKNRVMNMVKKMRDGEWKVIRTRIPVGYDSQGNARYSVAEHTDVVLETSKPGIYMSLVYYDKKFVKRSDGRRVHNMITYKADYVDAHVTGVFTAKDGMVQSTAQDRSDDRTYFNMATQADADKYHAAFREATVGAQGFLLNLGTGFTSGQLVDVATRLSSHACSMGMRADQGAHVESIGIVLSKNGFGDGGDAFINVETFCRALTACTESEVEAKDEDALNGKQIQFRAFLMKCTGLLKRAEWIVKELKGLRCVYMDVSKENFTEDELKLLQALGTKLVKGAFDILKVQGKEAEANELKAKLADIDCVVLYNGKERTPDDCPDIIATLNEVKNVWEFGICSGYNVLLMPHYAGDTQEDFRRVYTSNQMFKVAYRLAHDTDSYDELEEIVKAMIDRRITELTDYDERAAKAKVDTHFGPIDTSYSANTLLGLNKDDMYHHPELQVLAIRDCMDTLGKECTMDRWPMAGATLMFHMDPSFYALRCRDGKQMDDDYLPKDTILKIRKNGMIEVYSSLANKFFAERGIEPNNRYGFVMKYPAMGTRESAIVLFISDEEMARRVDALKGISFHDKLDIIEACNHQGYGTVFAPADLQTMGWILAGLDRDGDEGCFVFHEPGKKDLAFFLKEHGFRPLAVSIGKKGIEPKNDPSHSFGFDVFGFASRAKADFGNMKIGPVTYGFMRCLQPLMADWAVEIKKAYLKRFAKAFGMKKNGAQVYHPVIDWSKDQDTDSFGYAETEGKVTGETIISRIKAMKAFTGDDKNLAHEWHELVKIAKDLDVLGRHTQELTIDAGKKFYEVAADFVNDVAKSIGLVYQKFGVKFECNWKTALDNEQPVKVSTHASEKSLRYKTVLAFDKKTEKDAKTFIPALEELPFYVGKCDQNGVFDLEKSTLFFPDFFAKMRRYAINASLDALNNMVAIYKASCEDEDLAAERADRYDAAYDALEQAGVRGEINYIVDTLAMTVRHAYAERQAEYRKNLIHDWMSVDEENRAEEAIRKQLHEDFDALMERVNNMLRLSKEKAIAAAEDLDDVYVGNDTFVDYICGNDNGMGGTENGYVYAGKLLKAELAYTAISRSDVHEAREQVTPNRRKDAKAVTEELADIVEYQQLLVDEKGGISYIDDDDKEVAVAAHVNADRVPEGYYDAVYDEESDSVMLVKPLTDFVEIPEANHDELTLPVMMNAIGDHDKLGESIEKLQVAASEGKKIVIDVDDSRYHNVTIYAKDPSTGDSEAICEVYQGISKKGKRNVSKGIAQKLFCGVTGDFVDAVQTATKDEEGNVTARFGFITVNNLERPDGTKVDEDDDSSFFGGDEPEIEFHQC